ncbi:MAG: hypothetical protein AAB786_00530 [Patescibacteria group bacterium]
MGMEKFGGKIKRVAQVGALAAASMLHPEGAQASEATLREQFLTQKALVTAQFEARINKEKDQNKKTKLANEQKIALATVDVELAKALHVADEQAIKTPDKSEVSDPDKKFGTPYEKEKDLAVFSEVEEDMLDADGKATGKKRVRKLSPEEIKLEKLRIKEEGKTKRKEADASQPKFVNPFLYGGGYYGGGGYRGGSISGHHGGGGSISGSRRFSGRVGGSQQPRSNRGRR